jgi:nitrate/nitrite transporter NarK
MRAVLARRQFWTMAVFFVVAIGSSLGLYNMLSLFLVSHIPFARETANLLIGV